MKKEKLLKKISESNSEQVEKYFKCIQKVIKNDAEYYHKKEYIKNFKK